MASDRLSSSRLRFAALGAVLLAALPQPACAGEAKGTLALRGNARNEPTHLAGKLAFDSAGSGGPKVDIDFDAPPLKEFTAAR